MATKRGLWVDHFENPKKQIVETIIFESGWCNDFVEQSGLGDESPFKSTDTVTGKVMWSAVFNQIESWLNIHFPKHFLVSLQSVEFKQRILVGETLKLVMESCMSTERNKQLRITLSKDGFNIMQFDVRLTTIH